MWFLLNSISVWLDFCYTRLLLYSTSVILDFYYTRLLLYSTSVILDFYYTRLLLYSTSVILDFCYPRLLLWIESQNLFIEDVGSFIYRWQWSDALFASFDFRIASCCKCSAPLDRWKPNLRRLDLAELLNEWFVFMLDTSVESLLLHESTDKASGFRKVRGRGTGESRFVSRVDWDDNVCNRTPEDCVLSINVLSLSLLALSGWPVLSTLFKLMFRQLPLASIETSSCPHSSRYHTIGYQIWLQFTIKWR
jgi:hypothetical protein